MLPNLSLVVRAVSARRCRAEPGGRSGRKREKAVEISFLLRRDGMKGERLQKKQEVAGECAGLERDGVLTRRSEAYGSERDRAKRPAVVEGVAPSGVFRANVEDRPVLVGGGDRFCLERRMVVAAHEERATSIRRLDRVFRGDAILPGTREPEVPREPIGR